LSSDGTTANEPILAKQEEKAAELQDDNHVGNEKEFYWQWKLTPACKQVLNESYKLASFMKHLEISSEHLMTALPLDEVGREELHVREYNAEAVFKAASLAALEKSRLSRDIPRFGPVLSNELISILNEADKGARGCEKCPRAISTADIVDAIAKRPDADAAKMLMSAQPKATPAEEARENILAVSRNLNAFEMRAYNGLAAIKSAVESITVASDLKEIRELLAKIANEPSTAKNPEAGTAHESSQSETSDADSANGSSEPSPLATGTANDNHSSLTHVKKALFSIFAVVALLAVAWPIAQVIGADSGRSVRFAWTWFSHLLT
jgi:hypothetical protein